ncbi:hypothetical protein Zm00014a_041366, partial [Zea mays]
ILVTKIYRLVPVTKTLHTAIIIGHKD